MRRLFSKEKELSLTREYIDGPLTLEQLATRENCKLSSVQKIVARNTTKNEMALARGRNVSKSKKGVPRPDSVKEALRRANVGPVKEKTCQRCGKTFYVTPGQEKHKASKYCSRKCYQPNTTGKKPEPPTKKTCQECGGIFQTCVSDNSIYCSRNCMAQAFKKTKGPQTPNWKGGTTKQGTLIRSSANYREWRIAVFKRDNYTCQKCGARGVYLEAHHIKPFHSHPELRFDTSNGVTVCQPCHAQVDESRRRLLGL